MNILPLPIDFDLNEWCTIGISLVCFLFIYVLPKRFKARTVLALSMFNINLVMITDFTLGVKPFNFYDFMDQPKLELLYNLIQFTFYPGIAYLILYFYDYFNLKKFKTFIFLMIVAGFLIVLEWAAIKVEIMAYNDGKWNLYYSFIVYFIAFTININFFNFLKKL